MNWSLENIAKLAALTAAAYAAYFVATKGVKAATAAATGVVVDAASGVVIGAGKAVGIPETDDSECARALREGRTWDASFACPAGTFLKHVTGLDGIDRELERFAAERALPPWVVPVGLGAAAVWAFAGKGARRGR
jgi:hypothetical protein